MKLIHYADAEFKLKPRKYNQSDYVHHAKPNGFWVSVEGDDDWKWWCEAEGYCLESLAVSYEVELKSDANILYLKTAEEIYEFSKFYNLPHRSYQPDKYSYQINWAEVKTKYQGIIISPYQWDCRLDPRCCWYYGWDCASGCIWDLDCIKEFKLRKHD